MIKFPELKVNSFNVRPPTAVGLLNGADQTQPGSSLWSMNVLFGSITPANFMQQQAEYKKSVQAFSDSANDLNTAAKNMSSNLFASKAVASSNTAVSGTAKAGATLGSYDVGVSQLASTQRNDGKAISKNAYGVLNSGSYTVGVKLGSAAEKQLTVNVAATDTNKQVLNKFAKAINDSNSGVVAAVKSDKNGDNYLSVESKTTGAAQSFSLRDIKGDAINKLGLSTKTQAAADANYTVNGKSYTSTTNEVKLDNGNVSLSLNAVTVDNKGNPTTAALTVGKNTQGIVSAAKKLVDAYNKMGEQLASSDLAGGGVRLASSLAGVVSNSSKGALANIGISIDNSTGELAVDEKKLTAAINKNSDQVKNVLSGTNGFAGKLERISKQALSMPTDQYLQKPELSSLQAYNGQAQLTNLQTLLGSQQNSWQGLFMDMMV